MTTETAGELLKGITLSLGKQVELEALLRLRRHDSPSF
jgi:hypothetical protein